jgi:hypothetical protein
MADNNYNVEPVDIHQNITGLTPAKNREEKKKRQNQRRQENLRQGPAEDEPSESGNGNTSGNIAGNDQDKHTIDYCA